MTTPTVTETRRHGGRVGERVELARYTVPAGERILYAQRVDGVVRVTDVPARGRGRAYLVERELEQDGYSALKALVSDYVRQGELLDDVPMAVSPLTGTRSENLEGLRDDPQGPRARGSVLRRRRRGLAGVARRRHQRRSRDDRRLCRP